MVYLSLTMELKVGDVRVWRKGAVFSICSLNNDQVHITYKDEPEGFIATWSTEYISKYSLPWFDFKEELRRL